MSLFAARNEIVTIILALIPVAVFILSNLYKALSKPNSPPKGLAPKPNPFNPQTVPRTMDLEAFLREAKKQPNGNQGSPQKSPYQNQAPTIRKAPLPGQVRKNLEQISQAPSKSNNKSLSRPKIGAEGPKPGHKKPDFSHTKLATNLEAMSLNLAQMEQKKTPKENPVALAIGLLKKPNGGAELMVLREILGPPRCRNPFRTG